MISNIRALYGGFPSSNALLGMALALGREIVIASQGKHVDCGGRLDSGYRASRSNTSASKRPAMAIGRRAWAALPECGQTVWRKSEFLVMDSIQG